MEDGKAILLGLVTSIAGVLIVGLAIWGSGEGFNAPRWVVAAAGGCFFLAGMAILGRGYPRFYALVLALMVSLFGAAITWVSFGPGEREFTSTVSLPFLSVSGPASEIAGRICFAPGAVLLDLLALYLWFQLALSWLGMGLGEGD